MSAKDVGASGRRHAHASWSRWTDGRKPGTSVIVSLPAMEDAAGKSGGRVDIGGGRFLNWFLFWLLVCHWGHRLRRLGQGGLLPEEERA